MRDNLISDIKELEAALLGLVNLVSIQVNGNPVVQIPKFRDKVIMLSQSLELIDEKKVLKHERQFIYEFYRRKKTGEMQ